MIREFEKSQVTPSDGLWRSSLTSVRIRCFGVTDGREISGCEHENRNAKLSVADDPAM